MAPFYFLLRFSVAAWELSCLQDYKRPVCRATGLQLSPLVGFAVICWSSFVIGTGHSVHIMVNNTQHLSYLNRKKISLEKFLEKMTLSRTYTESPAGRQVTFMNEQEKIHWEWTGKFSGTWAELGSAKSLRTQSSWFTHHGSELNRENSVSLTLLRWHCCK